MPKTDNLPKDYVRLRYVKSPTPKDIRLFLGNEVELFIINNTSHGTCRHIWLVKVFVRALQTFNSDLETQINNSMPK